MKITNKENPTNKQFAKERGFKSEESIKNVDKKSVNKVISNNQKTKRRQ